MNIEYKTHYDEDYWAHKKTYRASDGTTKTYFGPSLEWEGFEFIAHALGNIFPKKASVLDVGCGSGDLARRLLARGLNPYGIDISEAAVRRARPEMRERVALYDASGDQLWPRDFPFEFDVVMSTDFLEHIYAEDLDNTFALLLERTRRGGLLFFLVAVTSGEEFIAKKGEPIPLKWEETAISGHVNVRHMGGFWMPFFERHGLTIDWRRMYLFQSMRERVKAWKDTAGWDMASTVFLRKQ